nr:p11 protein [Beet soil-borne mosaic virus]
MLPMMMVMVLLVMTMSMLMVKTLTKMPMSWTTLTQMMVIKIFRLLTLNIYLSPKTLNYVSFYMTVWVRRRKTTYSNDCNYVFVSNPNDVFLAH